LFPVELNSDGLAKALGYLADRTEKVFGIKCHFNNNQGSPIGEYDLALPFFRIAQEAVNNAVKHAEATQIDINLINSENRLTMTILDNGKGIPSSKKMKNGIGMYTMGFRATSIGATLKIENAKQGGTVVVCDLLSPSNRSGHEEN
jgi:signal transduction histidine kinase